MKMYTDYSTARINHNHKQAQFSHAAETDRLLRQSKSNSPTLKSHAKNRLGDGLITMGKLLKNSNLGSQKAEPCR
jgi:hypothetical protein